MYNLHYKFKLVCVLKTAAVTLDGGLVVNSGKAAVTTLHTLVYRENGKDKNLVISCWNKFLLRFSFICQLLMNIRVNDWHVWGVCV